MMAGPKITIAPPERKPRKGGIKSVLGEFTSAPRLAAAESLQWISEGCEFPKGAPGLCYVPNPVTGNKTYNGIEHGTGPIFALYAGVQCYLGTGSDPDYDERARALLEQGEGRAVEEVLVEWARAEAAGGATFTSITLAVAELEEVADTGYLGLPVLIMSRGTAVRARAEKAILEGGEDGKLFTANGTPVIATSAADDDELIAIGWPTVYASDFVVTRTADLMLNQEMAIAERVYGLAVDCGVAHKAVIPTAGGTQNPPGEVLELTIGTEPSSPIPDGTDVTVTVHANEPPVDEVYLWYRINGGAWTDHGEMTETDPTTFVENLDGTLANPGDVFDLYAKSGTAQSPTITINVT
jgi:hypothetical protein